MDGGGGEARCLGLARTSPVCRGPNRCNPDLINNRSFEAVRETMFGEGRDCVCGREIMGGPNVRAGCAPAVGGGPSAARFRFGQQKVRKVPVRG
jgi:hypothetical protein